MKKMVENNFKNFSTPSAIVMIVIILTAFTTSKMHQQMDELTVKRINIIEDDGTIRMVLSNKERQHPGRMDGVDSEPRERHAGIIFFNDEGDESGGLVFGASEKDGIVNSGLSLTFDQYKNDQVVQILNNEMIKDGNMMKMRGFMVNDFPEGSHLSSTMEAIKEAEKIEDPTERRKRMIEIQEDSGMRPQLFLGKSREGMNGLFINDAEGNLKLMIYVDREGNPKIQAFTDEHEIKDLF